MGDWIAFRQMKKLVEGTIQSGTVLDLRSLTGGVPWENEQIFLDIYSYLPDFTKTRYYAEAIPLGNNKYQIICRLVGYDYSNAKRLPHISLDPNAEWITLYNGPFYGVSFTYNNTGTLGVEGHRAYASGNLFVEHAGSRVEKIAGYTASYFNPTQQNGAVVIQQFGRSYGGTLSNITIFTTPAEIKDLLVNFVAMEGDF